MNLFNIIKFGLIFILVSFLSILFNIVMGFIGIQFFYGTIVALLITIISIYFKVILPLYIGSFFGMIHVLEWHWLIATLICLPGLLFITPNLFRKTFNINTLRQRNKFNFKSDNNSNFKHTMKTNVKNEDIIEGDYEVIKDEDKNKIIIIITTLFLFSVNTAKSYEVTLQTLVSFV